MNSISLTGVARTGTGKKATKATRREGRVPCVVYGGGETAHFSVTPKEVKNLVYTPEFKMVDITIDGTSHNCILRDIQFHPVSDEIMHMDFLKLVPGNTIKVTIPVRCVGTSPGVVGGGRLNLKLRSVLVKTNPEALVGELTVDISKLELNDSVRVKDIVLADGIEMMSRGAIPIASVEVPRAMKSAEAEEAEEGATEGAAAAEGGDAAAPAAEEKK